MNKVIFSVDVEEWWSVHSFRHLDLKTDQLNDRIEAGIDILLDMLDKHDSTGIFFVLGRVAEKHPKIIRHISDRGHQIASHGYAHKLIYSQTPDEFEEDIALSLKILEDITSEKVMHYRAPSYSITEKSLWALEVLANLGIKYDSSIVATSNSRFGIKNAVKEPYTINLANGKSIVEIPPNVAKIGSKQLPITSGFAFRLFPKQIVNKYFRKLEKTDILPMIVLHNWEVDTDHPKVNAGFKGNTIHYHNLGRTEGKLKYLLKYYKFSGFPEDLVPNRSVNINQLA